MIGNRTVRLSAQWVCIKPCGLERVGIECLNAAVRQADKQHSLGKGRGIDGKVRAMIHLRTRNDRTGKRIDLQKLIGLVYDQVVIAILRDQDGAAERLAGEAVSELVGPAQDRRIRCDRRFGRDDAVGIVAAPEGRPRGGHRDRARRRSLLQTDILRSRFRRSHHCSLRADVTGAGRGIAVGASADKVERAVRVGPHPNTADHVIKRDQSAVQRASVGAGQRKRRRNGLGFHHAHTIGLSGVRIRRAGKHDLKGLRILRAV